jgi:TPR repeat protein
VLPLLLAGMAWQARAKVDQALPAPAELARRAAQAQAGDEAATVQLRTLAYNGLPAAMPRWARPWSSVPTQARWPRTRLAERAAARGDAFAALQLGKLWFRRPACRPPRARLAWLEQAAAQGQAAAAHYLALILRNRMPQTAATQQAAAQWMRRAASRLGRLAIPARPDAAARPGCAPTRRRRRNGSNAPPNRPPEAHLQLLLAQTHGELGLPRQAGQEAEHWREAAHGATGREAP